jgi:hypothetical protein
VAIGDELYEYLANDANFWQFSNPQYRETSSLAIIGILEYPAEWVYSPSIPGWKISSSAGG